jgi:tetratricopeptide (TPR) repeat protein
MRVNNARYIDEALKYLRRALSISPNFVSALSNVGKILLDRREYDGALSVLNRAQSLDPENSSTLLCLGAIAHIQGQYERAASYFQSSV